MRTAALLGIALAACAPAPDGQHIAVAGCEAVFRGGACELPADRTLRVFVSAELGADVVVGTDAAGAAAPARVPVPGGGLYVLQVPAGAHRLTVDLVAARRGRRFALRLKEPHGAPWFAEVRELRRRNRPERAAQVLEDRLRSPLPPDLRARAVSLLARIAQEREDARGAEARFREALELDRKAQLLSWEGDDALMLAHLLYRHGKRLSEAERLIEAHRAALAAWPEGRARVPYYLSVLASARGDARAALRYADEAELWARRLRLDATYIRSFRGTLLQEVGRSREAAALFEELRDERPGDPCKRANIAANLGYSLLLEQEARPGAAADPVPPLREALHTYEALCPQAERIAHVHSNLAQAALLRGDPAEAERWLGRARAGPTSGLRRELDLELELLDREGRLDLLRAQPAQALLRYDKLAALGRDYAAPESRYLAAAGRAAALQALGREEEALAAYAEAEDALDAWARLVPLGAGRASFVGRYERSTGRYLDLLLGRGPERALPALRRARGRGLLALARLEELRRLDAGPRRRFEELLSRYEAERQALDQDFAREAGLAEEELPAHRQMLQRRAQKVLGHVDEALALLPAGPRAWRFRPPAPGELLLGCYPVPPGWACVAQDEKEARVLRAGALDVHAPEQVAQRVLLPLRAMIERARVLRVLAYGELREVDFHALPWLGGRLLEKLAVVYPLDLPLAAGAAAAPGPPGPRPKALVVGDPQGHLPRAYQATADVAAALAARGTYEVTLLRGARPRGEFARSLSAPGQDRAASGPALRQGLLWADLFHYGGHGHYADRGGWLHALPTADDAGLGIGDILAAPRVPPWVVLVGCDTGRSGEESGGAEGLGLAQAFLARGSRAVIGTVREIADETGAEMARSLYRNGLARPAPDLVGTLHRAQREVLSGAGAGAAGTLDWAAFRVFVP